jgi:hypothetical protein
MELGSDDDLTLVADGLCVVALNPSRAEFSRSWNPDR